MLEHIGELYKRERKLTLAAAGDAARHLELRQEQLKPLLEESADQWRNAFEDALTELCQL